MKIVRTVGREDLAQVYIAESKEGKRVEFVQSLQPPFSRSDKWVLIVSTLYGCPVECEMCDAGGSFAGKLSAEDILFQIDHMVDLFYPSRVVTAKKFKIQFARVGEPSFNENVLAVLRKLPKRYEAKGLLPSLSTIAPRSAGSFFEELLEIKNELYRDSFQLQFSVHSTDEALRDRIMPVQKWNLEEIAEYGARFYTKGGRKVTLNFILADDYSIDPRRLKEIFSPEEFFIKMTPLNPTFKARAAELKALPLNVPPVVDELKGSGFDVLYSIGELEENQIGSNCGQYIKAFEDKTTAAFLSSRTAP